MAKRDEVFPSKYLKASDLKGKPLVVTITSAELEVLKSPEGRETSKTVLGFKGAHKVMPLNVTNWDAVAAITGEDDSDRWPGYRIEIFPTTTEMKGKIVDCIRIRPPPQRDLPEPKAKAKPEPEAELVDDMSDDIPWR